MYIQKWINEKYKDSSINAKDIERLGGLTNRNYRVKVENRNLVVRLPGKDTDLIINRQGEGEIVEAISNLGIDAPFILFDYNTGIKLSEYLDNAITMSPASLIEDNIIKKIGTLFQKLHNSKIEVSVIFDPINELTKYENSIVQANGFIPDDYYEVKKKVLAFAVNESNDSKRILCHNDPLCENFVLSNNQLYLVDWEYAGMNNPFWDLADVSIEADYNKQQDLELLQSYLGNSPTNEQYSSFLVQKLLIDLLWSLWGFIREATKDSDDTYDYHKYGIDRYNRLLVNLSNFNKQND